MIFANSSLQRIERGLKRKSRLKFVLIVLSFALLNNIVFSFLTILFDDLNIKFSTPPIQVERTAINLLLSVVIIAPVLETLLFQHFIYIFFRNIKFFIKNPHHILFISAFLFGLAHHYHLIYLIGSVFGGFIYMFAYMARIDRDKYTFWLVVLIHSTYNAILSGMFLLFDARIIFP